MSTMEIPNRLVLENIADLQRRSAEVARRCQLQLNETEEIGKSTLDVLQNQRDAIAAINNATETMDAKLDHSNKLLNRFDIWAGHWYGRNKRISRKEGIEAIKEKELTSLEKFKESVKQCPADYYGISKGDMRSELFISSDLKNVEDSTPQPDDRSVLSQLDGNTRNELREVEFRDAELDQMLYGMAESLDRLSHISKSINEDVVQSKESIKNVATKLDQAYQKQFFVNRRLRRNLNK